MPWEKKNPLGNYGNSKSRADSAAAAIGSDFLISDLPLDDEPLSFHLLSGKDGSRIWSKTWGAPNPQGVAGIIKVPAQKLKVPTAEEVAAAANAGTATIAPAQAATPTASAGMELSRFLPGTKWITDQKDAFVKELSFTMDGNLIRTDQYNKTLQTSYQMGSDADSASYKKSDGKEVSLRFSTDRQILTINGGQTLKRVP